MPRKSTKNIAIPRRGPGRPLGSDREESRTRIITAAIKIFSSRGYSDATNAVIAREAGMTSGAIYHYYDTKKDLFAAAAAYNWERISQEFAPELADPISPKSPVGTLESLLAVSSEIAIKHPDISRFAVTVASETERHEELAEIGREYRSRRERMLGEIVDLAIELDEINMTGLSRSDVVALLMVITDGLARLGAMRGSTELHSGAIRALNKLLEGTLFKLASEK